MRKKQLKIELEKAQNVIKHLENEIDELKMQRKGLVDDINEPIKKAEREVYLALADNLKKSLAQKNVVNMKPDEKDAMYYLLERLEQTKPEKVKEPFSAFTSYIPFMP